MTQISSTGQTLATNADASLATGSSGSFQINLPASPTSGQETRIVWVSGSIPPVVNAGGNSVGNFGTSGSANLTTAATTTINVLGSGGLLEFDSTTSTWWWIS
jgi:hypothetical protein